MKPPAHYISDHLLISSTLAFTAGIIFASRARFLEATLPLLSETLLLLLAGLVILQLLNRSQQIFTLLLLFCFGLGFLHTQSQLRTPGNKHHIYNRITEQRDLVVIGTMAAMEKFDGRTTRVPIAVEKLQYRDGNSLEPAQGTILLTLPGDWPQQFLPGDTLAVRAELMRPASYRTPGGFDYAQYLARNNIWVTAFTRSAHLLHKVTVPPTLFHRLRYLPERTRAKLGRHIDKAVVEKYSGIYRALLIGDRSQVDDQILETFKSSGTMHILAISGLHLAVIGSLIYLVSYYLLSRSERILLRFNTKKWAAFLTLPFLVGYGLLAGMNTPVVRAVIMSGTIIIAICADRRKSPGPLLAFAALLILALDPLQLFSASFQLSFAATGAILFFLPRLLQRSCTAADEKRLSQKFAHWLVAALLISIATTLATAPISIITFNRFSLVGPLANLVIEPLICLWSLPAGFLAIPILPILPEISKLFLQAGTLGLGAALHATTFFSSFAVSTLWMPTPPVLLLVCYYLILGIFAIWGHRVKNSVIAVFFVMILSMVLFCHALRGNDWFRDHPSNFQVTYLDVGQGSASLVEFSSGHRILIDGGGSSYSSRNIGETVIAPFLWKKGIAKLDAVAITHPDADHYNGLGFILMNFSPKILWIRDRDEHDDSFRQLLHLAKERDISIIIPQEQQRIGSDEEYLACIANTREKKNPPSGLLRKGANSGLVLKACYGDFCVLFPGDIGKEEEKRLVDNGYNLNAEVLLAPHHGSSTSSSAIFVENVAPAYMIVSAGRSPAGHFPHHQVREQCRRQQITLLSTALQGTLTVVASLEGYQLFGYGKPGNNPLYPLQAVLLEEAEIRYGTQ